MKICYSIFLSLFLCSSLLFADSMSINEKEVDIEQKVAEFAQQADWMNVDSYIDYIGYSEFKYETSLPEDEINLTQTYFDKFDYIPNTDNNLITKDSIKDLIGIKSEQNIDVRVKYNNLYNIPISDNYPKIYYRKQNSNEDWNEAILTFYVNNVFGMYLNLDYGVYEYYVCADNEKYPGVYKTGTYKVIVTERPKNFKNLNQNLQDEKGNSNTSLEFKWSAEPGVIDDVLRYKFLLGPSENSMQEYDLSTQDFYIAENLLPRTRYYWKVEVENQYGVKMLNPQMFCFVTLGQVARVYNAPNPFNPQKGQKTRIFFEMPKSGSVEINIYSEYGDKIRTISLDNLSQGTNEIEYDGKDDYGNTLYNGTYLCVLKKKYDGNSKIEKCRLLIIK